MIADSFEEYIVLDEDLWIYIPNLENIVFILNFLGFGFLTRA